MTLRRQPGQIQYGAIRDSWPALPRGYIDGLILTRDAVDTDHYINIAAGVCRDSTNTVNMEITDLTKRDDATWAVGNDAGGLNATDFATGGGGPEATTWYHVFVIQHTDGTTDAGFDKDVDATNLLADSGYTYYRHIGYVLTDATEDFIAFTQIGDDFIWIDPDANGEETTGTYGAALDLDPAVTNTIDFAPPNTLVYFNVYCDNAGFGFNIGRTADTVNIGVVTSPNSLGYGGESYNEHASVYIDGSRQYQVAGDGGCTWRITVTMWTDRRGKDA